MESSSPTAVAAAVEPCEVGSGEAPSAEVLGAGEACRQTLFRGIPSIAGKLMKLGGSSLGIGALKSWRDRWVVLDGPYLKYYEKESQVNGKPRGVMELDGAQVAHINHPKATSNFVFQVSTHSGRKEPFIAPDADTFMAWMNAIQGVVVVLAQFPPPALAARATAPPAPAVSSPTASSVSARSGSFAVHAEASAPVAVPHQHENPEAIRRMSLPPEMLVGSPTHRESFVTTSPNGAAAGAGAAAPSGPEPQTMTADPPSHSPAPLPQYAPLPLDAPPAAQVPPPGDSALPAPPGVVGEPGMDAPVGAMPNGRVCGSCQTPATEDDAMFCENCGTRL